MALPNWTNQTIWTGDNLYILRGGMAHLRTKLQL